MKKYVVVFTLWYFVLTAAFSALMVLLEFRGREAFNITAMLAASFLASRQFTKDTNRLPTPEETRSYALSALASAWGISLVLVLGFVAIIYTPAAVSSILSAMSISKAVLLIFVVSILVISAIYYFAIRWSFSWYAKRALSA